MSKHRFALLIAVLILLAGSTDLLAQRGGGGRGARSRPFICVYDCREASAAGDQTNKDLNTFERLMAVQSTPEQSAAFAKAQQDLQSASKQFKTFRLALEKNPTPIQSDEGSTLYQSLNTARRSNQSFLDSFSDAQKSGLKEIVAKAVNADSDLNKQLSVLNDMFQAHQPPANFAGVAATVDTALGNLQSEQLALAREMSILSSNNTDLIFHLPQVTASAEIGGQKLSLLVAGEAIRSSVTDGRSLFDFRLVVDLSELQDNITDLFRSQLNSASPCGQHIEIQQAMLLAEPAGSVAELHLHHERAICPPGAGGRREIVVASGNATVEIKLHPSVDPNGDLHLAADISRIDADQVFRDSLLTGSLGPKLSGQVSNLVLSPMKKGADLDTILPPVGRPAVTVHKAEFQAGSGGQLRLVLDGQLRLSEDQLKEFAAQLRQQLSAQATSQQ